MNKNPTENQIEIYIAQEEWERNLIYQFRYKVFIEEMGKQCAVDNINKQIKDDLDDNSILLYAVSGSEVAGVSRLTLDYIDRFPKWLADVFCLDRFKKILGADAQIGLSTKMAVAEEYRKTTVMYQLYAKHFNLFLENNTLISFGGSNAHLISMYERLGMRRYTNNFSEQGHGLLIPYVLILDDVQHYRDVRSPLYRLAKKFDYKSSLSEGFKREFPEAEKIINSQIIGKEELGEHLKSVFNQNTQSDLQFLNKLSRDEQLAFFELGVIFSCVAGDHILSYNEVSHGLYFLLSGVLMSASANKTRVIKIGDYFGDGLTNKKGSTDQIIAASPVDILLVSEQNFEKFKKRYPHAASIILQSLREEKEFYSDVHIRDYLNIGGGI